MVYKRKRNGHYKAPAAYRGSGRPYRRAKRAPPSYNRRNTATMGFLGIEKKFYDTSLSNAAITAPADSTGGEHDPSATSMISTPVRGDSEEQRDGKQISILNCTVKGIINVPQVELAAGPAAPSQVYVALVLDTQTNGAQLNSEDVFKNTAALAKLMAQPQKNLLFMKRFRILKSVCLDMTPDTLSHFAVDSFSYNGKQKKFNWFVDFKSGLKVNFNAGTTASVANVIDNSLHIISFASGVGPAPTLSYNARIRFVG